MATYTKTVHMSRASFERVNALLSIDQFGDDPDRDSKLQVEEDSQTDLFSTTFDNGVSLTLYLCSGKNNYYIDYFFTVNGCQYDGSEVYFDLSMEESFTHNDDTYTVTIELK